MVSLVSGVVVILYIIRNVRGEFIVVDLMCLGRLSLSCWDVFVCRTCLGHNCSVEKLEFKRGEYVLEEVEKFCYLGDMVSCYSGAAEAASACIGIAWKKFRELSGVLVGKQGLSLKQRGKIYQCCVRPVVLITVANEARLRGVERHDQDDVWCETG